MSTEQGSESDASTRPGPGRSSAAAAARARRIGGATARPRAGASDDTRASVDTQVEKTEAASDARTTSLAKTTTKRSAKDDTKDSSKRAGRAAAAKSAQQADTAASLKAQAASEREGAAQPAVVTEIPTWLRWAPAAILVAAAIAMAAFVAVSGHGVWYAKPAASTVRDQVLAAAKTCTVKTNTYNYTTFDKDEQSGAACTTGAQTTRYRNAMHNLIKATAVKLKASQVAQINTAAVEQIARGGQQWTVLLYGQLSVKTSQIKTGSRVDPFAAQVIMQRVDGKWLISQINSAASATT